MAEPTFKGTIAKDDASGSTCVVWPDSVARFGTGKPVRVTGTVDGHGFETSMMPTGQGAHMLPLKASIRKAIGKDVGDAVEVLLIDPVV